ncbi:MAG: alanyl-tRNA editing protein [Leptolyngbyaceae cyanobacterium MO_188.B28]|nr:alanyl-tRNA editing protein [Leptolyngbyaceae cyanobacterium MO_188.B28]
MTEELFREDAYLQDCEARILEIGPSGIRLDRTVFYPMGGGQPGDKGVLRTADGQEVQIVDTRKDEQGILHIPDSETSALAVGDSVTAAIDWPRRYRHMRMHTALHLLCAVVEGGVTGGQISETKSRLDFNIPDAKPDKQALTEKLNALVQANHPVSPRWISEEELAEKPELIRTMSVKPPMGKGRVRLLEIPDVDLQPCGGTHVCMTGEIGQIQVSKIESKGKQNRRINIVLVDQE